MEKRKRIRRWLTVFVLALVFGTLSGAIRVYGDTPGPGGMSGTEAKETLSAWIMQAKQAESELTGKGVSQIPDDAVLCDTDGKARLRLVSAAGCISDTESHDVYIIAKDVSPTGICLKEAFGTNLIYSNEVMETMEIGGSVYKVHRFGIRRSFGDSCEHKFEITMDVAPTCTKRGMLRYRCSLCDEERITYRTPTGHTDENSDGICETCGNDVTTPIRDTHWYVGDTLTEMVGDREYVFTCIDEDYIDPWENHTHAALFLCDTVLPAGLGGAYKEEDDGTGHLGKVWHPGPIACFGATNSYKKSKIKAFLDASASKIAETTEIGVSTSYTGATKEGKFSRLNDESLSAYSIGYQRMEAKLFILSLEEAVKYRRFLWKFGGSTSDDPETMIKGTCTAYWLRTPFGLTSTYDETGMAYVVDLVKGNIHPQSVTPLSSTGDPYLDTQTATGIRPAFLIAND